MADKRNDNQDIAAMRRRKVVKSNELIQKRTHMLSLQEQKIILFLISQLKPEQKEFESQIFDIVDFCEICGISADSGKNYDDLKKNIKNLRDKSMWVVGKDKGETLMGWISNAKINPNSGQIAVRFDEEMKPYLLELKNRYTQYDLIYTLGMKSKYSIRLYELCKSYERIGEPLTYETLDRFREAVGAEYEQWYDIKRRIILPAKNEINSMTDITVNFEPIKRGRLVVGVRFNITPKRTFDEQTEAQRTLYNRLEKIPDNEPIKGQLTLEGGEIL